MKLIICYVFCLIIISIVCNELISMKENTIILSLDSQRLDITTSNLVVMIIVMFVYIGYQINNVFIHIHTNKNKCYLFERISQTDSELANIPYGVLVAINLLCFILLIKGILYGSYDILLIVMPSLGIGYYWRYHSWKCLTEADSKMKKRCAL